VLRHYLVAAIRSLGRQRLHSALAILVLALGLTCFLAGSLAALYLDGYDRQFAKSDRTYVIYQSAAWPRSGYQLAFGRRSAPAIAEKLAIEVPELEAVARQTIVGGAVSIDGRSGRNFGVAATDPEWLDIFAPRVVAGDARAALERQNTVVLTVDVATQLFDAGDAIGRTLTISGQAPVEVTVGAVVRPIEGPSHLAPSVLSGTLQVIASWDVLQKYRAADPRRPRDSPSRGRPTR
jgi:putative ABC transport system permease protein